MRTLAAIAAMAALAVGAAGCGGDQAVAPDPDCDANPRNCVTIGIGEPIPIGTLLFMDDASGADTRNTVTLALDYLDGEFDALYRELVDLDGRIVRQEKDNLGQRKRGDAKGAHQDQV